jgi:chloramphenicol 3-O phosphotransferase
VFAPDGSISVAEKFRKAEESWYEGLAAIARAGTGVVVDEVFLDGGQSQVRLHTALNGLDVLWVGVRCEPGIAETRELERNDRVLGMARSQAERVHDGVSYDIVVDTSHVSSAECARAIVATTMRSDGAP